MFVLLQAQSFNRCCITPLSSPFSIFFTKESGRQSRSGRGNPDGLCELASHGGLSSGPSASDVSSTVSSSGSSVLQDERLLRIAQQVESLKDTMVKSGEVKNKVGASYTDSKPLTLAKSGPDTSSLSYYNSLLRVPTPQTRKVTDIISHLQGESPMKERKQLETAKTPTSKPHANAYVLPDHVSWNDPRYQKKALSNLLIFLIVIM